jgi:tetratricopeptide (TPR) repeat protein
VYLPLIGAAFCCGALVDALAHRFERLGPFLRYALPLVVLAICTPAFVRSQQRFIDDPTLWGHALQRYPYNARLCRMWANGIAKQRGPALGLSATDRCMSVFGDELFAKNKGVLLGRLGRFDEARTWLERARELRPSDASVRAALANLPAATSGRH